MQNYYKLTDAQGQTRDRTQWGENVTHNAPGEGDKLCTAGVIHVYDSPLKAVLFNPIHAGFRDPHLWECTVQRDVADDGLKVDVKSCTTVRQIPLPVITTAQRVRFGILCTLGVYEEPGWVTWARNWLDGSRIATAAANAAANAAYAAKTKKLNFDALAQRAIREENELEAAK